MFSRKEKNKYGEERVQNKVTANLYYPNVPNYSINCVMCCTDTL